MFMDARMPVTHEEGDRYPLGPPKFYSTVAQRQSRRLLISWSVVRSHPVEPFCPGDGIGIRVGLRSQILGVRVSLGAPYKNTLVELDVLSDQHNYIG